MQYNIIRRICQNGAFKSNKRELRTKEDDDSGSGDYLMSKGIDWKCAERKGV
jgi:hypothetical protein